MSRYIFGSSLSYADYLQARSFEQSITRTISTNTRALIATEKDLHKRGITIARSTNDSITGSVDKLTCGLDSVSQSIVNLGASFEWGFSELLAQTGAINQKLEQLLAVAKTPAQTWAYEQFEIARTAFARGLDEDAIDFVNRAINGFGDHTGYKIDFRFHFLAGLIQVGSFRHSATKVLDLSAAEKSFVNAAKYAQHEEPSEAGRSLLAAAWAQYAQGEFAKAEDSLRKASALLPDSAECCFQTARVKCRIGKIAEALPLVRKAILLESEYALKAAADEETNRYSTEIRALLEDMRDEVKSRARVSRQVTEAELSKLGTLAIDEYLIRNDQGFNRASEDFVSTKEVEAEDTYFGLLEAVRRYSKLLSSLPNVRSTFIRAVQVDLASKITEKQERIRETERQPPRDRWVLVQIIGITASLIGPITACCWIDEADYQRRQNAWEQTVAVRGLQPSGFRTYQDFLYAGGPPIPTREPPFLVSWSCVLGGIAMSVGMKKAGAALDRARAVGALTADLEKLKIGVQHADAQVSPPSSAT